MSTNEDANVEAVVETQNQPTEAIEPEVIAPEVTEPESTEPQESDEAKALRKMERRIGRRTAELYKARAENETLAERIARLEAAQAKPQEDSTVDPSEIERFVRQQAKQIAEVERVNEKCNRIADEGKKAFPDFNVALQSLAQETGPLFDRTGKPTPLMDAVLDSDAPAQLLYHLGTNPDLAADLLDLTPTQIARRIVKIESTLHAAPKQSNAPKPIAPTKGAASNTSPSDSDSDEVWMRKEAARLNALKKA